MKEIGHGSVKVAYDNEGQRQIQLSGKEIEETKIKNNHKSAVAEGFCKRPPLFFLRSEESRQTKSLAQKHGGGSEIRTRVSNNPECKRQRLM